MSRWQAAPVISPQHAGGMIASAGGGRPCGNTGRPEVAPATKGRKTLPTLSHDGQALSGALVDWLAFTVRPEGDAAEQLLQDPDGYVADLLRHVFDDPGMWAGPVEQRGMNGYTHRAEVHSGGAHAAGSYVCLGGNNGTVNVQLSGTGCAAVRCWYTVALRLSQIEARITRVDLAFDDYAGKYIELDRWVRMAQSGEVLASAGKPPKHKLITGDSGTTLYVGRKGSKELCVYEKGKEQGDESSPWLRAEVRFWAKDRVIPYAVLTQCLSFIRAAYNVLAELPGDVCKRIKTVARSIDARAVSAISWARRTVGGLVNVLANALGEERARFIVFQDIRRNAVPRRFASFPRDQLNNHLQVALCPF